MTDHNPEAIATAYFAALDRGALSEAMGLLSAEVVWHQPGANRFSGVHYGAQDVGSLLGEMMDVSQGTFQLTVTGPAMTNGDLVAVPVNFSGTRKDASMNITGIDLLTVRNGLIVEVHLFTEDSPAEDTFWGLAD